jgi:hypothetical protein
VVSHVVGKRLEQLDSTFLATLDGYMQGAREKGAADVAGAALRWFWALCGEGSAVCFCCQPAGCRHAFAYEHP